MDFIKHIYSEYTAGILICQAVGLAVWVIGMVVL